MLIGYINSKWSMPRRLMLISAVFLIPSLIQLYVYTTHKLEQINAVDGEIEGADLARAIWAQMASDEAVKPGVADRELSALVASSGRSLGVQSDINAFVGARTAGEQARLASELLDQVADASALTLGPSLDTYHAQKIFIQSLPSVKLALVELQDLLGRPDAASATALAMNDRSLREAAENLKKPLADLMAADTTGDAKRTLGAEGDRLMANLEVLSAKLEAAGYQRNAIGSELNELAATANRTVASVARDAGDLFVRLAETHAGDDRSALYRTLALLIAATIAAVVAVAMIARGISLRLTNLVRTMDQISHKDLAVEIPYLTDSNENGMIAKALVRFKDAAAENKAMTDAAVEAAKQQQEQSDHYAKEHERFMEAFTAAADRIAKGDFSHQITEKVISEYDPIISQMNLMMGQLEGAQVEKIAAEKQIHLVVDALGTSLSELADGNLEASVDIDVAPEFAKLKADFNSAASQLKSTIALVKKGAGGIKLGTEEISQASDDLSRRTENQAASLEETAAAVKEITDTVNKTARGATHARETVSVAKSDAEKAARSCARPSKP